MVPIKPDAGYHPRHDQAPKLPPTMPVLMLGGMHDEVVPRSQMQELWAIIRNRGRGDDDGSARSLKSPSGAGGSAGDEEEKEDDELGPANRKAPPRVLVDGENTYIEFRAGTHSE